MPCCTCRLAPDAHIKSFVDKLEKECWLHELVHKFSGQQNLHLSVCLQSSRNSPLLLKCIQIYDKVQAAAIVLCFQFLCTEAHAKGSQQHLLAHLSCRWATLSNRQQVRSAACRKLQSPRFSKRVCTCRRSHEPHCLEKPTAAGSNSFVRSAHGLIRKSPTSILSGSQRPRYQCCIRPLAKRQSRDTAYITALNVVNAIATSRDCILSSVEHTRNEKICGHCN